MRATLPNRHHRSLEKSGDAFDDVSVGHRDAYDWSTASGGWRGEERALAFEDPDQPVEVLIVD
jgi:hypothetical protein